ncbi:hypothetical protein CLV70_1031 [Pseudosporangium ferrugineum]|uniref:Uncharacterized protein n=1 Tax=Pseudosporangium ferrugineum TaxID=439699 RepID=A0A2T0SCH3_9ACTN|nr:hypothetical protein CLV70_1031 [Pseudosporangium ferrugineum]
MSQATATASTARSRVAPSCARPTKSMVKPKAPPSGTVRTTATAASRRAATRKAGENAMVAMAAARSTIPRMLAAACMTSPTVVGSNGGKGQRSVQGTVPDVAAKTAAPPSSAASGRESGRTVSPSSATPTASTISPHLYAVAQGALEVPASLT